MAERLDTLSWTPDCAILGLLTILAALAVACICGVGMAWLGKFRLARAVLRYLGWPLAVLTLATPYFTAQGFFEARLTTSPGWFALVVVLGIVAVAIELAMFTGVVIMTLSKRSEDGGLIISEGSVLDVVLNDVIEIKQQDKHGDDRSICALSWITMGLSLLLVVVFCILTAVETIVLFVTGWTFEALWYNRGRHVPTSPLLVLVVSGSAALYAVVWLRYLLPYDPASWQVAAVYLGVGAITAIVCFWLWKKEQATHRVGSILKRVGDFADTEVPLPEIHLPRIQSRPLRRFANGSTSLMRRLKAAACPIVRKSDK